MVHSRNSQGYGHSACQKVLGMPHSDWTKLYRFKICYKYKW